MGLCWLICVAYSENVTSSLRFGVKESTRIFVSIPVNAIVTAIYKLLVTIIKGFRFIF